LGFDPLWGCLSPQRIHHAASIVTHQNVQSHFPGIDHISRSRSGSLNLIKQVRMELIEKARPLLEVLVHDITGQHVKSLHTDISTATGERIIVFSLAGPYAFQGAQNA